MCVEMWKVPKCGNKREQIKVRKARMGRVRCSTVHVELVEVSCPQPLVSVCYVRSVFDWMAQREGVCMEVEGDWDEDNEWHKIQAGLAGVGGW